MQLSLPSPSRRASLVGSSLAHEKAAQLEELLAKERQAGARAREQLAISQRDLVARDHACAECKAVLAALRERSAATLRLEQEQRERVERMEAETNAVARKSRQRFDAAVDLAKQMLLPTEEEEASRDGRSCCRP